jgi:hypothetical protein
MRKRTWTLILAIVLTAGLASAAQRVVVCEETYAEY